MVNILTSKDSFKFRIVELILLAMLKNEDKYGYQISQEVSDQILLEKFDNHTYLHF